MKIFMSDMYRVESFYPLDDFAHDILYYLYQPLISNQAISVYMMLYTESKRMRRYLQPSSLDRLISCLDMSLIDIENALLKLEGIGLLKSYKKIEHGLTLYLFHVLSPLSLQAFFKNQILNSLLLETLSHDDYQRTISYFKLSTTDVSQYEDVTVKFQDVFTIKRMNRKMIHFNDELTHKQSGHIDYDYDTEMLFKSLLDYQISKIRFSDDDIHFMTSLALVYSIDPMTLAGIVKDSMTSLGLNRDMFKMNIKKFYDMDSLTQLNEVYHKQPVAYASKLNDSSLLASHMKYLDSLTPYELLKSKQGGKEPIFHDLKIVETLMVQLELNPAVVNVLIEYVLGKCDNKLSRGYCESIGATLKRKNVKSAIDAYHILMNNEMNEDSKEVKKEEVVSSKEHKDIDDELQRLMMKIGDL